MVYNQTHIIEEIQIFALETHLNGIRVFVLNGSTVFKQQGAVKFF